MWSTDQCTALADEVHTLSDRYEIEETLARCYNLRGAEIEGGIHYSGPGLGGTLFVRYHEDRAQAVVFLEAS